MNSAPQALVIGRSGVDLYPLQVGVGLEDVETFGRFLGGSAANVAVAAARLGRRVALVTGVGDDPFGRFVRRALGELGVDSSHLVVDPDHLTPVTFCEIFPPDNFPLYFYRKPAAPDLQIRPDDLDLDAVRAADLLWMTTTGLSEEPSRSAHHAALAARGRKRHTVLDLDYRPMFWESPQAARRQVQLALAGATVAVGNREECEVAVGETDPDRVADALLDLGLELAVVKQGPRGVMGATRHERVTVTPTPVEVVNGLGAGDSFGGSLIDGSSPACRCPSCWPTPTPPGRSSPGAWSAPPRCPRPPRSPTTGLATLPERLPPVSENPPIANPPLARSYAEITELRARHPEVIAQALAARRRRPFVGEDGKLMIVAADHPARGALSARGRADAMASRTELLDRLQTALARPGVDGLLATADIAEDLLLLGALEGKVVVASMNRGGIAGASYEFDDRMTGYDVPGIVESGFDAGKMLLRFALDDAGTAATHEACARAVTELNRAKVVAMVEPFMSTRTSAGTVVNDLSPEAVIKSIHISQGIGASSAYTWMKLPVVDDMERVMDATTLPTLILGGDPVAAPEETYAAWRKALGLPAVRGLVVGRALLFPPGDDVAAAVDTAVSIVR